MPRAGSWVYEVDEGNGLDTKNRSATETNEGPVAPRERGRPVRWSTHRDSLRSCVVRLRFFVLSPVDSVPLPEHESVCSAAQNDQPIVADTPKSLDF